MEKERFTDQDVGKGRRIEEGCEHRGAGVDSSEERIGSEDYRVGGIDDPENGEVVGSEDCRVGGIVGSGDCSDCKIVGSEDCGTVVDTEDGRVGGCI